MNFLLSGNIWATAEGAFFLLDAAILALQFFYRSTNVRKSLLWFFVFLAFPILGFIAWVLVGTPVWRRRIPTHEWEDKASLDSLLAADPDNQDLHMARVLNGAGALHFSGDSDAMYLGDGKQYYTLLEKDIRKAKESVNIECYIVRKDRISEMFFGLLKEKAKEGIDVRIMFDDFGYDAGNMRPVRELAKAGVKTAVFHNMNRLFLSPKKNYRNHRKTFVIDGRIGYMGGYNIGDEYVGEGRLGNWRDAAIRIEGPQAQQLQRMFADDWEYATKENLDADPKIFHNVEAAGDLPMQVIPGDPIDPDRNAIEMQFISMCHYSRSRLWIETPYFVPRKSVLAALCVLAGAGVDLRIIIPDQADHPNVYWANRHYANIVMKEGAKVYEYNGGFLHTKMILGDDHLCSVGSANFDERSTRLNFECNIMMFSEDMGKVLEEQFLKDQEKSTEYSVEQYASRTGRQKFRTAVSMMFYDQL